jgi:hypothetical protein
MVIRDDHSRFHESPRRTVKRPKDLGISRGMTDNPILLL